MAEVLTEEVGTEEATAPDTTGDLTAQSTEADASNEGADSLPTTERPRDESGRFAAKTEAVEPTTTTPGEVPVALAPPSPTPVAPVGNPFAFRHGPREHPVEGATLMPDGSLVVKPERVPWVQQQLSAATEYGSARQEFPRQLKEAREQVAAETAVNRKLAAAYNTAIDNAIANPEQAWEEFQAYMQKLPGLRTQVERDYWKEQAERASRPPEVSPEEEQEREQEYVADGISQSVEKFRMQPWAANLLPADWKWLEAQATQLGSRLFIQHPEHGLLYDDRVLSGLAEDRAALRDTHKKERAAAVKVAEHNARQNAKPPANGAPLAGTRGTPVVTETKRGPHRTPEERDRWMRE